MTFEELMECHAGNRKVYEELLARFKANRVVPLFGAGMSAWAGYPKIEELLLRFCDEDEMLKSVVHSKLMAGNYGGAAELVETEIDKKEGGGTFRKLLANKFKETEVDEQKWPEYQRLFPKLFRGVLLATNYEALIERLYPNGVNVVNPADAFDDVYIKEALQGGNKQPVLLKLRGDMGDPQHIVLTQKDYDDAYGADADKPDLTKPMPKYLDMVLSSNVVLFLGSSLQTDHTVKMVKRFCANQGLTHFAVMALARDGTARTDLHDWGIETIWFPSGTYDEAYGALFSQLVADLGIGEADDRAVLPVRDLVGREKEVEEIRAYWAAHREPPAPLVWVSGLGGIGKTELCKAVCVKLAEAGKRAFIPMFDLTTLEDFYAKVLTTLGQDLKNLRPDKLAGKAAQVLENCCTGGVAYFDNAEDLCDKLDTKGKTEWRAWLDKLRDAKVGVVVSSRMTTLFAGRTNCKEVDVKRLADDAAKTLFTAVWGRGPEDYELDDYNWLIGQLEGYPLAIVLVALQTRARGYLDRAGWDKAAAEISPDDQQSHVSMEIALRTSWEAIRQEPQAVELWGVFHMSVVSLGIEMLKGLFDGEVPAVGLGKLLSLGLVDRVEGGTVTRFDMLNPIKRQFSALAGDGAVKAARKRWLAYLRALLPCADQTDVPKEKRVAYAQECAARWTVHGLLPQVWRLLEDLCFAGEANAAAELMGLAGNFFSDDLNSMATLEVLRGFFRDKSKRKKDFAFATWRLGTVRLLRGENDGAEEVYAESLAICREIGDRQGEANVLDALGEVRLQWGEYAAAEEAYEASLAICREIGYRQGEANALLGLGHVRRMRGEYAVAEEAYEASLAICREIGYRQGEANVLLGLGDVRRLWDEYDRAEKAYDESLAICREIGCRQGEARALLRLGEVRRMRSEYDRAKEAYDESLVICREIGYRLGESNVLRGMGHVWWARGEYAVAEKAYEASLVICREIGYRLGESNALRGVGHVRRVRGEYGRAEEAYDESLAICREIGYRLGEANVLLDFGKLKMRGGGDESKKFYDEALELCDKLKNLRGVANADVGLGLYYEYKNDHRNALTKFKEALEVSKKIGYGWGRTMALKGIVSIERKSNTVKDANLGCGENS